jgi:2'-hydroxyisoflavone reductase
VRASSRLLAERGGRVLAPAPPERPVQLIDARDLAAWLLDMASRGAAGVFNAVGAGHTMAALLEACRYDAPTQIVWVAEGDLLAAGIEPWSRLPLWIPSPAGDMAGFFRVDGSRAVGAGLRPRPLAQTARETLAALARDGEPQPGGRTVRAGPRSRRRAAPSQRRPLTMLSTRPYSTASAGVM